jgi:hypothetical protein
MSIKDIFKSSDDPQSWGSKFRDKRFKFLSAKLETMPKPVKILDIGGLESFWTNRGYGNNPDYLITILNLEKGESLYTNINMISGNAIDLKEIGDREFDLAFSNSVIEHLHTFENQVSMASEVRRVGVLYSVQTPNKHFLVEPHYVLPFFDYLPAKIKYFILTKTKFSRLKKWTDSDARQYISEIRLLTLSEFKQIFPGSKMDKEYFMGLLKSFTAHNF